MKVFVGLLVILVSVVCASELPKIRGLSPEDAKILKYSSTSFTCRDNSKTIDIKFVNDDFCDCADASDEPGTSACPNGKFWCLNKKYKGEQIYSSRVGDGICDCCDGSDENGGVCPDTCSELAAIAKKDLLKELENQKFGVEMKQQHIYDAESEINEKRQTLENKRQELEDLKQKREQAEEIKKQKEEIERNEREKLEAEKKAKEEAEQQNKPQEGTETGTGTQTPNQDQQQEIGTPPPSTPPPSEQSTEEKKEEATGNQEESPEEDEEEEVQVETPKPQEPETKEDDINSLLQPFVEESSKARREVDEFDNKIRNVEKEIQDLEKVFQFDFGEKKEFFHLYGNCYSVDSVEYTYEVCPFDKVNQKPKNGGGATSLGSYSESAQTDEWKVQKKIMVFTNGVRCWGGPDRSTRLQFFCGAENRVEDPQEPNKCEYSLKFYTPAACSEEHVQALELNLESMFQDH